VQAETELVGRPMAGTPVAVRRRIRPRLAVVGVLGLLGLIVAGCGGHSAPTAGSATSPSSSTPPAGLGGGAGETSVPASSARPSRTATAARPPVPARVTEQDAAACPFVDTQAAVDAEGNRVSRITVLVQAKKVIGCRYYFWCCDFHATMEMVATGYPDTTTAYNVMVRLGQAGAQTEGVPGLAPGVDGVLYRTSFYQPDGKTDWACSFAAGKTVVTVKTDQNDTSHDALNVAKLLVPHFTG